MIAVPSKKHRRLPLAAAHFQKPKRPLRRYQPQHLTGKAIDLAAPIKTFLLIFALVLGRVCFVSQKEIGGNAEIFGDFSERGSLSESPFRGLPAVRLMASSRIL